MHYKLSLVNIDDQKELHKFLEKQSNVFPYRDTYQTSDDLFLNEHHHTDFEARLILEGNPTFTIYGEDVVAGPGSYIEILPHVRHSFKSTGNLKSIRFFSMNDGWVAVY